MDGRAGAAGRRTRLAVCEEDVASDAVVEPLVDHWRWRPDWTHDRVCRWWYLTFDHDPVVVEAARAAQAVIADRPDVDVVPPEWLHLTLLEVGFVDEVGDEETDRVVAAARETLAGVTPFEIELGPVGTMPGAIVLRAAGHGLSEVHDRLLAARLRDPSSGADEIFEPHVSVAYVNRGGDAREVVDAYAAADLPLTRTLVTAVALNDVTRRDRHYQWSTRDRIVLR